MATLVLPGLADLVWVIRIFMDVLVMMKLPDAPLLPPPPIFI